MSQRFWECQNEKKHGWILNLGPSLEPTEDYKGIGNLCKLAGNLNHDTKATYFGNATSRKPPIFFTFIFRLHSGILKSHSILA